MIRRPAVAARAQRPDRLRRAIRADAICMEPASSGACGETPRRGCSKCFVLTGWPSSVRPLGVGLHQLPGALISESIVQPAGAATGTDGERHALSFEE